MNLCYTDYMINLKGVIMKTIQINFRISTKWHEYLKQLARELSVKTATDISYTELIKNAIKKEYPELDKLEV